MRRGLPFWCAAALVAVIAAGFSWSLRWTCDDACISFRYADHLASGHGLVFNLDPAEAPVEGYAHFAWLVLLAAGVLLGFGGDALEGWAAAIGTASHGLTVLLLAFVAWRVGRGRLLLPAAALAYALHHHAASLAPAGLETALFTLLVTGMAAAVWAARTARHWALVGALGALMVATRIDGALFGAAAGLVALCDGRRARSWQLPAACAACFALLYGPYFAWRLWYYGDLFPNVFYAKSAADPYPQQGLHYLAVYLGCYWVLVPALLLLPCCAAWPGRGEGRAGVRRLAAVALLFVLPWVGYVAWVGGDFMFARFMLPITPLALLAFDLVATRLPVWAAAALAVGVGAATLARVEPGWLRSHPNPHGFSDNRAISVAEAPGFGVSWTEACRSAGHYLARLWDGLPVRVGIAGSHANLAWRARVPVAIECATGLTDAYIARLELPSRGTVAHEKNYRLFPGYLEERGVHVMFELSWGTGDIVDAFRDIWFPSKPVPTPARLVCWDKKMLAEWQRRDPGVRFHDFEQVLDRYLGELPDKDPSQVRRDYAAFERFYFDHNDDPARRARFEEFLRDR